MMAIKVIWLDSSQRRKNMSKIFAGQNDWYLTEDNSFSDAQIVYIHATDIDLVRKKDINKLEWGVKYYDEPKPEERHLLNRLNMFRTVLKDITEADKAPQIVIYTGGGEERKDDLILDFKEFAPNYPKNILCITGIAHAANENILKSKLSPEKQLNITLLEQSKNEKKDKIKQDVLAAIELTAEILTWQSLPKDNLSSEMIEIKKRIATEFGTVDKLKNTFKTVIEERIATVFGEDEKNRAEILNGYPELINPASELEESINNTDKVNCRINAWKLAGMLSKSKGARS